MYSLPRPTCTIQEEVYTREHVGEAVRMMLSIGQENPDHSPGASATRTTEPASARPEDRGAAILYSNVPKNSGRSAATGVRQVVVGKVFGRRQATTQNSRGAGFLSRRSTQVIVILL